MSLAYSGHWKQSSEFSESMSNSSGTCKGRRNSISCVANPFLPLEEKQHFCTRSQSAFVGWSEKCEAHNSSTPIKIVNLVQSCPERRHFGHIYTKPPESKMTPDSFQWSCSPREWSQNIFLGQQRIRSCVSVETLMSLTDVHTFIFIFSPLESIHGKNIYEY